jgi:hypothetical protein
MSAISSAYFAAFSSAFRSSQLSTDCPAKSATYQSSNRAAVIATLGLADHTTIIKTDLTAVFSTNSATIRQAIVSTDGIPQRTAHDAAECSTINAAVESAVESTL